MRKHALARLLLAAAVSSCVLSSFGCQSAPAGVVDTAADATAEAPVATALDVERVVRARPEGTVATTSTPRPLEEPAPRPDAKPDAPKATAIDVLNAIPAMPSRVATSGSSSSSSSSSLSTLKAGGKDLAGRSVGANGAANGAAIGGDSLGYDGRFFEANREAKRAAKAQALLHARAAGEEKTPAPPPPPPPPEKPMDAKAKVAAKVEAKAEAKNDDLTAYDGEEAEGQFAHKDINPLIDPKIDRLSTFAIDVDTGSFTLARRFLEQGAMPAANGVRVEEWVNAFHYSYAGPESTGGVGAFTNPHPFTIDMEGAPLAKQSMVLRVGIQGKRIAKAHRDPVHLVFLVDVSGSMSSQDRLPLAKQSLDLLVNELNEKDSVGLVTYAGATEVVLPSTTVSQANRARIKDAIASLRNGGGTNMGSGMELAYREANKALGDKGIARVIVLSDGDANIGRVSHGEILKSIKGYVSEGVTMSTIGFGTGNYRDDTMEGLADAGNGNYAYVGSMRDAKKVFVDDLTGTLQVIAKDTKIQVEMNPEVVKSYRLIGYENRDIADEDFRNDKVDAGEIGAGHTVTALYEVQLAADDPTGDIATVRVRYKQPKGEKATEVAQVFTASMLKHDINDMSVDGRFAVGVGLSAEVFRHSPHMDRLGIDLADAERIMQSAATGPFASERSDFVRLIAPLANGANVARR